MPDEKVMKSVLDIQKTLESRPYAEAIEAATRATRSMMDAVRAMEGNSAVKQALESIRRHETLSRAALGPMWELRHSRIFDLDSPWRREMDLARQAMENFHARFRLPEVAERSRLLADLGRPFSDSLAKYGLSTASLQQAIESMRTPWLDVHERLRSIGGFAELQGIGHALRTMPAFDESLSAALRIDLGDWRGSITWRPEIFTDWAARSDFYISLGFNPALTDFPLQAFEQSLEIAGLRSELPPAVQGQGSPERSEDDEEAELERTNAAHDRLQRLERLLRKFIDEEMTRAFGANWPKGRLPNGLYDQWREKKRKAEEAGAEERPIIEYADFTDYPAVICRGDNWREIFARFFTRPENVRETFPRLHPIRLDVAHSRLITLDDELLLHVEMKRLVKVIVKRRN